MSKHDGKRTVRMVAAFQLCVDQRDIRGDCFCNYVGQLRGLFTQGCHLSRTQNRNSRRDYIALATEHVESFKEVYLAVCYPCTSLSQGRYRDAFPRQKKQSSIVVHFDDAMGCADGIDTKTMQIPLREVFRWGERLSVQLADRGR
ncbi:hypothetical protein [Asticcacaulis endophyticus]|uniref:hypothetical protein n=1 Tax=Asticcacaulis endophyticus TaxID=1395890 RepID=UPI001672A37C|nr:hypothetical protein [Asticcacaulis endophyticus]